MEDTAAAEPPAGRQLTREELERLVVDTVRLHADGLLRLARRHSLCADDAQDAYQRGMEIFLRHAGRLDPERAPSWLRTVVKHEAMAVRRTRQREVGSAEVDLDLFEARNAPGPEERVIGFEQVERSAEALQRLKPQEVRALWLRAQGNSYDEIQQQTGWSRTKVNRCLYEGRRSFLERYSGIESGDECRRWEPLLSALVDGEATRDELVELRPHLRRCSPCRAVVRELHRSSTPLSVVFPGVAVAALSDHAEPAGHLFLRLYEATTTWLNERAASSFVRGQMLVDGASASATKMTAVAASAAAVAGGGAVAVEQVSRPATGSARAATIAPLGRASGAGGIARRDVADVASTTRAPHRATARRARRPHRAHATVVRATAASAPVARTPPAPAAAPAASSGGGAPELGIE